ncbi:MAG TPA: hypothetical protein VGK41_01335 [Solirubrobacterales bacterium]
MDDHEPTSRKQTPLQLELLQLLAAKPRARLRWYTRDKRRVRDYAGRAAVMDDEGWRGRHYRGGMIPGYTVQSLIRADLIAPATAEDARPFIEGGKPWREYTLNPRRPPP